MERLCVLSIALKKSLPLAPLKKMFMYGLKTKKTKQLSILGGHCQRLQVELLWVSLIFALGFWRQSPKEG